MSHLILVGGTGRSGTSIVKELIATHPDVASLPFEYRFIVDPDGIIDFYTSFTASWSPYLADRRLKRLERLLKLLSREPFAHRALGNLIQWLDPDGKAVSPRAYHGWELNEHLPNFETHVERLMSRLIEFSFSARWVGTESYKSHPIMYYAPPGQKEELAQILGDFIRNVISEILSERDKDFFIEDNTWNILLAQELLDLLPDAKLIHVYRDPRDVVASFNHQRWSPSDRVQAARWYRAMMCHWFEIRSRLPSHCYHELSLESLVASPKRVLTNVCDFAGITFHKAMMEIDLSHSHTGRWRQEYTQEEKTKVQEILGDIIDQLGYGVEGTDT